MKYSIFLFAFLMSCQYIPDISRDIDNIATDTAIKLEVSREMFQKETDLEVNINVKNKDQSSK